VDVRFLAATNARLESLVQSGAFRADLYYRLCVFSVSMPPLASAAKTSCRWPSTFIGKGSPASGPAPRLDAAATTALLAYAWPGNVRELENAIERALAVAEGGRIETADLSLPRCRTRPALGRRRGCSRSYKLRSAGSWMRSTASICGAS